MIQLRDIRQSIVLQGNRGPRLVVQNAPRQTIKLTASGPRGPKGDRGERGETGPNGGFGDEDLPDFTLIFENKLA